MITAITSAGERRSKRKSESSLILWSRRGTRAVPITSVTEVIEVIGYQLAHGVLCTYLAVRLGKCRSFNPENCIKWHIRYRRLRFRPRPEQGYLSPLYIRDLNVQNCRFRNMPPYIDDYLVIKRWLSYREEHILDRREVAYGVQRVAR
jgi:hypothetical protein